MTIDASAPLQQDLPVGGLVERGAELSAIEQALSFVRSGTGAQVLVSGSGGLGKSRLLGVAADLAEGAGVTVLRGSGRSLERDFPFGLVIQMFEPLWTALTPDRRRELSAGRARAAAELLDHGHHPDPGSGDAATYPIIHGLYRMLVELTSGTGRIEALAVVADDIHESDAVSLAFLAYLSERAGQLPLTLVLATRPGDLVAHPSAFATLQRSSLHVSPAPLSAEGCAEVVRRQIADADEQLCAECHRLSAGNPLLLGALVTELLTRGPQPEVTLDPATLLPESVLERVRDRLAALDRDSATLAHGLVAAGDGAAIDAISRLTGLAPDAVARSARRLSDTGMLSGGEPLRFAAPLVTAAVAATPARLDATPRRTSSAAGTRGRAAVRLGLAPVLARLLAGDDLEHVVEACEGMSADRRTTESADILWARAWARLEQGDIAAARSDATLALDAAGADGLQIAGAAAILARCLLEVGDATQADMVLESGAARRGAARESPLLLEQRSRVRLAQHRPADALADALRAGELSRQLAPDLEAGAVLWRSSAALAYLALGDGDRAVALAEDELTRARPAGRTRVVIRGLRVLGLAARGDSGLSLLLEAVAVGDRAAPRLEHVHALVELGAALRRANRRTDAREPLRRALDLAHRSGIGVVETRARTELVAAGGRPRRLALTGIESLTASQRRVAELAARGLTTRQMAEALFVSPKTVEFHLRHTYQKLGVSSRDALAAALDA